MKGGKNVVKGVNKTVIEVNNTGSKVFDRIVFYINPSCSNLSAKNLNRAIKNFTFDLDARAGRGYISLRKRINRRRIVLGAVIGFIVVAVSTLVIVL